MRDSYSKFGAMSARNNVTIREESKTTRWVPSRNLGNYILCHVRRVSSKDEDDEDGEGSIARTALR
jgi:hypothetical protein